MGLNNLDDSREGIAEFLNRNPDTCFVPVETAEIVGVILADHDGRRGYIYHTAVHPQFQRRSIGAALVEQTAEVLAQFGIHKVALVAFQRNREGNAFWARMGFTLREDLSYRNKTITEMVRLDI